MITRAKNAPVALLLLASSVLSLPAFGWGQTGHRVSGAIAERHAVQTRSPLPGVEAPGEPGERSARTASMQSVVTMASATVAGDAVAFRMVTLFLSGS